VFSTAFKPEVASDALSAFLEQAKLSNVNDSRIIE
jgi:hypothetical protein